MSAYVERRVTLAIDFINTFGPDYDDPELLGTVEDLVHFLRQHVLEIGPVDEVVLGEVRALRDRLRESVVSHDPDGISSVVNEMLESAQIVPRLARERSDSWNIDLIGASSATAIEQIRAEVALGVALALDRYGFDQLRVCASDPCQEVFLDTSRNRSRRFCSERCANRHNVAAFRARQRGKRGTA